MDKFTVYTNEPPSLNNIVERFNAMTSTSDEFKHQLTFFSKEETDTIFELIQSYNVYADDNRKIPIPAREVYRNGGPVDRVLVFNGEKAIAQLSNLGIHTHGLGEENAPANITKTLREAFKTIAPEQILKGGNGTITIRSQEDPTGQTDQQSEMIALLNTIEEYNKINHKIFANAVLYIDNTSRI